jgi:hypothetical protein
VGFALGRAIRILNVENFVEKWGKPRDLLVEKMLKSWVEEVGLIKRWVSKWILIGVGW